MNIIIPKYLRPNNIEEFLKNIEIVWSLKDRMLPNVRLDVSRMEKPGLISLLLIYKLIDYSYNNNCFKKLDFYINIGVQDAIDDFGFRSLFDAFKSNKDVTEREYRKLKIKVEENLIIAPQALLRDSNFTKGFLKEEFLPKIQNYYGKDSNAVSLIFTCFSEILLNFWEHAVEDTKSILVATGNKHNIEIACADTGNGLISTLKRCNEYFDHSGLELIKMAFCKGVTSQKNTNHMGYGLWLINELVSLNRGRLYVFSEGFYYKNNFGKVLAGQTNHWKGTIVYISLPLQNPKTIVNIDELTNQVLRSGVKINFMN